MERLLSSQRVILFFKSRFPRRPSRSRPPSCLTWSRQPRMAARGGWRRVPQWERGWARI